MNNSCFIIAMDVITSLGAGVEEVWLGIEKRRSGITTLSRFPQNHYSTNVAAEIPMAVAEHYFEVKNHKKSWAYRLAAAVGLNTLDLAAKKGLATNKSRIGLILSTTKADIEEIQLCQDVNYSTPGRFNPFTMAAELALALNLRGPTFAVSCACASGLVALADAVRMLVFDAVDAMLVIGVDVLSDFVLSGFSSLAALSKFPCRPYDEKRDGLSLGEGAGAILLTKDNSVRKKALAVIEGWGFAGDATHVTAPSPQGIGLADAYRKLLTQSGLAPKDISYINGHGTGTIQNDAMEFQALDKIFGTHCPALSSMKGYIGHTLGAAGVIETALCVMALLKKVIPASLGFENSNAKENIPIVRQHLELAENAKIITVKCGFGGVNAVMLLSGAP